MSETVMSVREVAEFLGLAEGTVYRKVRSGELPAVRIGRSLRFPRQAIENWLESRIGARAATSAAEVRDPGHFTVTTGGGLGSSLRREDLYRGA